MKNPNQKMRFDDNELSLMKGLFAGNDELLYIIRKSLLQFPLNINEKTAFRAVANDQTLKLLSKLLLPSLDPEAPLFQLADMHMGLNADLKSLNVEQAWPLILAKKIEIEYVTQQLEILKDLDKKPTLILEDMTNIKPTKTNKEEVYANILAKNYLVSFIDSNINQVKFLAGLKEETVEQTKERLMKDSSK